VDVYMTDANNNFVGFTFEVYWSEADIHNLDDIRVCLVSAN